MPPETDHARFLVAFAMDPEKLQALEGLHALLHPGERFAITGHAAYLQRAGGLLESKAAEAVLGRAGQSVTTRNCAPVHKLATATEIKQ